jgi:RYamide receptor
MSNSGDASFLNTTSYSNTTEIYHNVPLYLKVLASIFYSISLLLGFGGNTLVLLIAFYYDRTRTVTNFFIINLAISDLVFVLLCIPSTYITAYLLQYWPFSNVLCVFFNYMQTVSVTLTVYTLIWITLDKFWALVRPFKLRMTIKECKYLILFSWIFSLFISLPIALFTRLNTIPNEINNEGGSLSGSNERNNTTLTNEILNSSTDPFTESNPQCAENWPASLTHIAQLYNLLLLLIQYFIPLIILTFCYARIGFVLKKQKTPGESIKRRDDKMVESKKKVEYFLNSQKFRA